MLNFSKRNAATRAESLGIALGSDRLTLAHITWIDGAPRMESCTQLTIKPGELKDVLCEQVKKNGWQGMPTHVVAAPNDGELLLLRRPGVSTVEFSDAVRWQAKEMLGNVTDDLVVDVLVMARDAFCDGSSMIHCATLGRATMNAIAQTLLAARLQLSSIDIRELALRNLAVKAAPAGQNVLVVQADCHGSVITVLRGSELYASRRTDRGTTQQVDELVVEIQRSVDYFESQMNKGVVDRVLLLGIAEGKGALIRDALSRQMPIRVETMKVTTLVPSDVELPDSFQLDALSAIGAGLRGIPSQDGHLEETPLVTLYQPLDGEAGIRPQWRHMMFGLGLLLGFMAADAFFTHTSLVRTEEQATEAWATVGKLTLAQRVLEESNADLKPDPGLPEKIERQLESNRQLKHVLERVKTILKEDKNDFSGALRALAQSHVPGASLREIDLESKGGNILLKGMANSRDVLFAYLDSLGRNAQFAGKVFSGLDIKLDSVTGKLTFTLASEPKQDTKQ